MTEVIDVWAGNLEEEFIKISRLIEEYPYVGMDTEFSGFLIKSMAHVSQVDDQRYNTMRINVNMLKMIQLGITLGNSAFNLVEPVCTWQFNFKFSLSSDIYANDSIAILKQAGIDFERFERDGIDLIDFAAQFFASGLVMNDKVFMVAFHGVYDFAYLLKSLSSKSIPKTEEMFRNEISFYFPNFYDLRNVMLSFDDFVGGLQELAESLDVPRIGKQHQAGSDSYVTLLSFFQIVKNNFGGNLFHPNLKRLQNSL